MQIGKYTLENRQKVEDAIRSVGDKDEKALLAEYDRRGGLMYEVAEEDGVKVKVPVPLGTFWDFTKQEPRKVAATARPKVIVRRKKK